MNTIYCTWTQTQTFNVIVSVVSESEFERQKAVTARFRQYGYETKQIDLAVANGDTVYIHARSETPFDDDLVVRDVCQYLVDRGLAERDATS